MGLVEQAIDKYIESVTEEREPDGMIHPSSASLCARRTVYAARSDGNGEDFDASTKRKFYIGHRIHEVVQRALEASFDITEFYAEPLILLDPPYNMKGSADAIIVHKGKHKIVEVKSISKGSLRYGGMPKEHHTVQAEMYAFGVSTGGFQTEDGTFSPTPVESIIYAYLEKENLQVYEYEQKYTKAKHKRIGEYLKDVNAYIEDGTALPRRLNLTKLGKKPWPCNYCPFTEQCWKIDSPEIPLGGF